MPLGMLRLRYASRKTVFEQRNMERRDVEAFVVGHIQRWPYEAVRRGTASVRVPINHSDLIAEWVTDEGQPTEKIELVPLPEEILKMMAPDNPAV